MRNTIQCTSETGLDFIHDIVLKKVKGYCVKNVVSLLKGEHFSVYQPFTGNFYVNLKHNVCNKLVSFG